MINTALRDAANLLGIACLIAVAPTISAIWPAPPPVVDVIGSVTLVAGLALGAAYLVGLFSRVMAAGERTADCPHCVAMRHEIDDLHQQWAAADSRASHAETQFDDMSARVGSLARLVAADQAEAMLGGTLTSEQRDRLQALRREDGEMDARLTRAYHSAA